MTINMNKSNGSVIAVSVKANALWDVGV